MNLQKPSPFNTTSTLPFHETFVSIQGEGPYAGQLALFVRLSGCNLACPGCDTQYSDEACVVENEQGALQVWLQQHLDLWEGAKPKLLVITGGEPFRHNLIHLVRAGEQLFVNVQIETNGTLEVPGEIFTRATIVCSPKGRIHKSVMNWCRHFKFVVKAGDVNSETGLPLRVLGNQIPLDAKQLNKLKQVHDNMPNSIRIYVQPMDEQDTIFNEENRKLAASLVLKYGYKLCLQMHKIVGVI